MLHAIEMQISLKNKEWFCVCVFVCVCACVCSLYVHAVGSSRRGGAQIGQVFLGGEETLENSHTHTHSRQLHMTQWRPADFHTPTSDLLTFF